MSEREMDALFSEDRMYRYSLFRSWERNKGVVLFVMLNPSTANEIANDPTINRCERFATDWGYGAIAVVNLYGLRSTDPNALKAHDDPIGPENDHHLLLHAALADLILCAWGNHGGDRGVGITELLRTRGYNLHCLKRNQNGSPVHPLYQPKAARPLPFAEAEE